MVGSLQIQALSRYFPQEGKEGVQALGIPGHPAWVLRIPYRPLWMRKIHFAADDFRIGSPG